MKEILKYVAYAAAGGVATSFAEYFLKYNLVDYIKDLALKLFGKAKSDVKATVDKNL